MRQFEFEVQSTVGIHARPAMLLAQKARTMSSNITVEYQEKTVNAKNMAALLTLRAYQGAKVIFFIEGNEETKDAKELLEFCNHNL